MATAGQVRVTIFPNRPHRTATQLITAVSSGDPYKVRELLDNIDDTALLAQTLAEYIAFDRSDRKPVIENGKLF